MKQSNTNYELSFAKHQCSRYCGYAKDEVTNARYYENISKIDLAIKSYSQAEMFFAQAESFLKKLDLSMNTYSQLKILENDIIEQRHYCQTKIRELDRRLVVLDKNGRSF